MLLKRVRVPKSIFAISTTLSGLVNLCLAYIPLFIIMIVRGAPIRPTVLFLPIAFVIIAIFTLGVSLLLSALAVYFEDVSQMYQAATMALMYLTPIIYPIEIIPYKALWLDSDQPADPALQDGSRPRLQRCPSGPSHRRSICDHCRLRTRHRVVFVPPPVAGFL